MGRGPGQLQSMAPRARLSIRLPASSSSLSPAGTLSNAANVRHSSLHCSSSSSLTCVISDAAPMVTLLESLPTRQKVLAIRRRGRPGQIDG